MTTITIERAVLLRAGDSLSTHSAVKESLTTHRATTARQASATSLVCKYKPFGHCTHSSQATEMALFMALPR